MPCILCIEDFDFAAQMVDPELFDKYCFKNMIYFLWLYNVTFIL